MNKLIINLLIIAGSIVIIESCSLDGSCPVPQEVYFTKYEMPDSIAANTKDTIKTIVLGINCMTQVNDVESRNGDTFSIHPVVTYNTCDCPPVEADTVYNIIFSFSEKGKYYFRYWCINSTRDTIRFRQDSIVIY